MNTPKLRRSISGYIACSPKEMAHSQSDTAKQYAFDDMRADIITLSRMLCEIAYPRRGTHEETQSIFDFAKRVQSIISHEEAIEL